MNTRFSLLIRFTLASAFLTTTLIGSAALAASGAEVYKTKCAVCHQASGKGLPGAFPPLAGSFSKLLAAGPKGRTYVGSVVIHGLQGPLKVGTTTFNGIMPSQNSLPDADLAAALNYVATNFGNKWPAGQKPFSAAELTKLRAKPLAPAAVLKSRPAIK